MPLKEQIQKFASTLDNYMPGVSLDCVILGYADQQLSVLVLNWAETNQWALPGGFIKKDEDLVAAGQRVLQERTGLLISSLTQFHTFGGLSRADPENTFKALDSLHVTESKIHSWFAQRFITVGFIALVDQKACKPQVDFLSDTYAWKPINKLPTLIYDHKHIIDSARGFLKTQLNYLPVGLSLLDDKFTMKDLQVLYETILDRKLDRANFQKRMLKLDVLKRHEKHMTGGAHKAPYLYSFDKKKYENLVKNGIGFST